MKPEHHSPSSLNLFCASPAMYVLEKIIGSRQPVGAPAHRGTAVEAGIALGLADPSKDEAECIAAALTEFDKRSALSSDPRKEKYRDSVAGMVTSGLAELRQYGVPSGAQG